MNNAKFFGWYGPAKEAWDRYNGMIDRVLAGPVFPGYAYYRDTKRPPDMAFWLFLDADVGLDPMFAKPGTLLRDRSTGEYCICNGPCPESLSSSKSYIQFDRISITRMCDGKVETVATVPVSVYNETGEKKYNYELADIPQQIVEIVKAQLMSNCPLKVPGCGEKETK